MEYREFWVGNPTDGEFVPMKIEVIGDYWTDGTHTHIYPTSFVCLTYLPTHPPPP